jgi:hypothetical protein
MPKAAVERTAIANHFAAQSFIVIPLIAASDAKAANAVNQFAC